MFICVRLSVEALSGKSFHMNVKFRLFADILMTVYPLDIMTSQYDLINIT